MPGVRVPGYALRIPPYASRPSPAVSSFGRLWQRGMKLEVSPRWSVEMDKIERQKQLHGIEDAIHGLVDDLDREHKSLRALAVKIEELEKVAEDAGLERVKLALRAAYVNVSQTGSKLVKAHMDLTIPATVFRADGEEEPQEQQEKKE